MKRELVERELTDEGPRRRGRARGARRTVTVNLGESPLAWLRARGHLDARQYDAGERLRTEYERAGLGPQVTMRWDAVRVDGGGAHAGAAGLLPGERQLAARERFRGALAAAGPGLEDVLWRVVCAGEPLAEAERALGWPTRSGKLVLGLALDRVAAFYGIR